ncbi:MAG: hypothetical protein RMM30_02380 [Armatimonadota bacterium]|nr:hypothetical protein [Armatimonadota bacterium]MDW8155419.1 hypothetical protein [Armatimonadota bacterium]
MRPAMAFTVEDFQDLLRLLREHPEWKDQLRQVLLADGLAGTLQELAQEVRRLAEAQARTAEELRVLAQVQAGTGERVGRLEEAVARLVEAQARTDERVGRLEEAVARLVEAQARTDERVGRLEEAVARLTEAQARTEQELRALVQAQANMQEEIRILARAQTETEKTLKALVDTVATLKGENLERRYRERAASYFQRILRRVRLVDHQQLGLLLDDALDQRRITPEERARVLDADVVVAGTFEDREVYLLAEVSGTVTADDVRRARERAAVLEKATGRRVLAAVAGQQLSEDPETRKEAATVWQVLDGRVSPPS